MNLKQIAKIILISCVVFTLSACAAKHHRSCAPVVCDSDCFAGNNGMQGAQASGMGENENFGGAAGAFNQQGDRMNRTYYFDFDRSDVHEEDKPAICANAEYLIAHPRVRVILEGHTDPRGSREYNVALAERRANAVAEILRARGVNPRQIRIVSYGAERARPGHTEQDYQLDRRAVIVISCQ